MKDHCDRVLKAIEKGTTRSAKIIKETCLGPNQVSAALRELRKKKLIRKVNGGHELIQECNG
jgi:predicted Rossmann fold nucleotide-binding protein DprA/Smf involved in DNA uptake